MTFWLLLPVALVGLLVLRSVARGPQGPTGGSGGGGGTVVHPKIVSRVEEWRRDVEEETRGFLRVFPSLVLAVIARESGGDPGATGDGGDSIGLMQIQQATWQDYQTATNDPETVVWPDSMLEGRLNIRVGSWTLDQRIDIMGSTFEGLRAYNAGVVGAKRNPTLSADYARWVGEIGVPAFGGSHIA